MQFRTLLVVSNVISFLVTALTILIGRNRIMVPIDDFHASNRAPNMHDARNLRQPKLQQVNDAESTPEDGLQLPQQSEEQACCDCQSFDASDEGDGSQSIASSTPSDLPSSMPSVLGSPSMTPSEEPSTFPSFVSSDFPSGLPSLIPTVLQSPSPQPSTSTAPSLQPSLSPSLLPSASPSWKESSSPSSSLTPSSSPSASPSIKESSPPSSSTSPSLLPSQLPSTMDSLNPSSSTSPSESPSQLPSTMDSSDPSSSTSPSESPSQSPSYSPSSMPSLSGSPSMTSSLSPSVFPSIAPPNIQPPSVPSSVPSYSEEDEEVNAPSDPVPFTVVLSSGAKIVPNSFVTSPNGLFSFRMGSSDHNDDPDDLLLLVQRTTPSSSEEEVIWRVGGGNASNDTETTNSGRTRACFMQSGGNMVLRSPTLAALWTSETSQNPGAYLILDDEGQLAIVVDEEVANDDGSNAAIDAIQTMVWMTGLPKGQYQYSSASLSPPNRDLTFPIRGTFYYPWFPETWTVNKQPTIYNPTLGKYQTARKGTVQTHLNALAYAHVELSVASWFGPDTHEDRARITNLLAMSPPTTKWTIYHEAELGKDPSAEELRADLNYIKKWFAWHDSWAHIEGRPVIFVYNEPLDCDVSSRWMEAAQGEWYVVLKLFRNFEACPVQPDSWHQYGPATAIIHNTGHSFSISPGFWRADHDVARLARVSEDVWRGNVANMVASDAPWQLITTFNEWGEGTAVESGIEWASDSGYGFYLDALHDIH